MGGGTTSLDLMKLNVIQPSMVVDITRRDGKAYRAVGRVAQQELANVYSSIVSFSGDLTNNSSLLFNLPKSSHK